VPDFPVARTSTEMIPLKAHVTTVVNTSIVQMQARGSCAWVQMDGLGDRLFSISIINSSRC
jgi:hypothetical protein